MKMSGAQGAIKRSSHNMTKRILGKRRAKQRFRETCRQDLLREGYDALFEDIDDRAIPPQFADLWLLAQEVSRTRPALVLEYGSGYSTYVIAKTLLKIGTGHLISVELDEEWRTVSAARLDPCWNLVEFVAPRPEIRLCNAAPTPHCPSLWFSRNKPDRIGIVTITFPELHSLKPNFIFLDGPSSLQVPGYADPVTMEGFAPIVSDPLVMQGPFTICVDGRDAQCAFLSANLPQTYTCEAREVEEFTIFRPT